MGISQEIWDQYIQDSLSQMDRERIEDQISKDQSLREELDLHSMTMDGLAVYGENEFIKVVSNVEESLEQSGFFSTKEELDIIEGIEWVGEREFANTVGRVLQEQETNKQADPSTIQIKKTSARIIGLTRPLALAIAASFAVIITAVIWISGPTSTEGEILFVEYYSIVEDDLTEVISAEMEEVGFADSDKTKLSNLNSVLNQFRAGDYDLFYERSKQFMGSEELAHYQEQIILRQIISLIEIDRFEDALVITKEQSDPSEMISWYRTMILLKLDRIDEAKLLLQEIQFEDETYMKNAESLLKRL